MLPTGKPTSEEAANLFGFANDVFQRLHTGLQSTDEIHLAPAELSDEEIENRVLRFLLKNVGDAVGIGQLRRTAAGLCLAPVLEAATGRPIGQLCYTAAGDFVSSESTPLEKLLGAGDGS